MCDFRTGDLPCLCTFRRAIRQPIIICICRRCAGVGVKTSSYMNSFLTLVNLGVMAVIVVAGFYYGNSDNWSSDGGFMPFGTTGVIAGAATCFYAYVGFDSIATSGEEAKDPAYSIPVATIIAMSVVCTGLCF